MTREGTIKTPGKGSPVTVIELCKKEWFASGDNADATTPVGPPFEGIGPQIADITTHVVVHEQDPSGTVCEIMMERSPDPHNYYNEVSLSTEISALGYDVGTPYATRESFGLFSRFMVKVHSGSAEGVKKVLVSVWVAIRYLT